MACVSYSLADVSLGCVCCRNARRVLSQLGTLVLHHCQSTRRVGSIHQGTSLLLLARWWNARAPSLTPPSVSCVQGLREFCAREATAFLDPIENLKSLLWFWKAFYVEARGCVCYQDG